MKSKKCKGNGAVTKIYLCNPSDFTEDKKAGKGFMRLKRKYGKFKREIKEIEIKKQSRNEN